jgi:hypothetical protein
MDYSEDIMFLRETERFQKFVKECLSKDAVRITFEKADGTQRIMVATTNPTVGGFELKEDVDTTRKPNPDICKVFDVEAKAWRSFRWDRMLNLENMFTK